MEIHTYTLGAYQTNCYIVSGDGKKCVIIDPADNGDAIYKKAKSFGYDVEAVFLTHAHFDHILGLDKLVFAAGGVPVYLHKDEVKYLADAHLNLSDETCDAPYTYSGHLKTVCGGGKINAAGIEFTVIHTPGHTDGSVCYRVGNVIFTGDTLFAGSVGRTDFPRGNYAVLMSSLEKLKNIEEDCQIFSGHGHSSTLNYEKQFNEYLQ
ncbi:MAG: MBL fold metallo-hydrolase [Clostridiales bacterium]|nr:MBL fold metallo-hydrolase [Clostridia bacterium]MCR5353855.1 MBL fold metallo-hydrolase [Clostridiales bacterium]